MADHVESLAGAGGAELRGSSLRPRHPRGRRRSSTPRLAAFLFLLSVLGLALASAPNRTPAASSRNQPSMPAAPAPCSSLEGPYCPLVNGLRPPRRATAAAADALEAGEGGRGVTLLSPDDPRLKLLQGLEQLATTLMRLSTASGGDDSARPPTKRPAKQPPARTPTKEASGPVAPVGKHQGPGQDEDRREADSPSEARGASSDGRPPSSGSLEEHPFGELLAAMMAEFAGNEGSDRPARDPAKVELKDKKDEHISLMRAVRMAQERRRAQELLGEDGQDEEEDEEEDESWDGDEGSDATTKNDESRGGKRGKGSSRSPSKSRREGRK